MGQGNGGDNAHNSQFGGGGRGPTGGVNMGGGNSSGGGGSGSNQNEHGYYVMGVSTGPVMINGRIQITTGMNWVSDNTFHDYQGNGGGNSHDNPAVKDNAIAAIKDGYRALIEGYFYTVTVDGNDHITSVNLYARPVSSNRKTWAKRENIRQEAARNLVQKALDSKRIAAEELARKREQERAAAEAQRLAEEEARRRQAEWDAAHPVEAAERHVNEAKNSVASAEDNRNAKQNELNWANNEIGIKQNECADADNKCQGLQAAVKKLSIYANAFEHPGWRAFMQASRELANARNEFDSKRNELNSAYQHRDSAQGNLNNAQNQLNDANNNTAKKEEALNNARREAQAKREAEERRQAEETAKQLAAKQEEERRKAAEAEAARVEAEKASLAAAKEAAMSKLEQPNVFAMAGFPASAAISRAPIAFAETGLGSITFGEAAVAAQWAAIRSVVADLIGAVVAGSGIGALIASIAYIPGAGEGSDKVPGRGDINMFMSAMPSDAIGLPSESVLRAAAKESGAVNLPVRGRVYWKEGVFSTHLVRTTKPSLVRVVEASRDAITGLYGYTIPAENELPSRTILVSPDKTPGYQGLAPLVTPVETSVGINDTGNQDPAAITPHIESFPMADDLDFRDVIIIFPAETGMKPIYVMLQSGRDLPGTVTGQGKKVSGSWLGEAGKDLGAPIPSQIADKLRGKEFKNFREFREAMWVEVARDPDLSKQFTRANKVLMEAGSSPYSPKGEQVGGRDKFEIHHVQLISEGGAVYDIDNMNILTPKKHIETHSSKGEY